VRFVLLTILLLALLPGAAQADDLMPITMKRASERADDAILSYAFQLAYAGPTAAIDTDVDAWVGRCVRLTSNRVKCRWTIDVMEMHTGLLLTRDCGTVMVTRGKWPTVFAQSLLREGLGPDLESPVLRGHAA
jgi:hypothetical protein